MEDIHTVTSPCCGVPSYGHECDWCLSRGVRNDNNCNCVNEVITDLYRCEECLDMFSLKTNHEATV